VYGQRRASRAITLVLISSIAVFFGFKSCYDEADADWTSTTQPGYGGGGTGSHSPGYHSYWSSGHSYGGYGGYGRSSGSHFSGTSRGGFGSSGHAAGA